MIYGRVNPGSDRVKRILSEEGPDLVFCMVQKNQDREGEVVVLEYEVPVPPPTAHSHRRRC